NHFLNKLGRPITTPYFLGQLRILYETNFYPWIISDALNELVRQRFLVTLDSSNISEFASFSHISKIRFFAHSAVAKTNQSFNRAKVKALNTAKLIEGYSAPTVGQMLGNHLEALVRQEVRAQHFVNEKIHTNEYNGKKWTETDHNLD